MKFAGSVRTIVCIIHTKNEVASIKGALVIRLGNFVF